MFDRLSEAALDAAWHVLVANVRVGKRVLRTFDRLETRRLARRYERGPGRPPTRADVEFALAKLAELGIEPTPLKRAA
jgi:hypothetical protein